MCGFIGVIDLLNNDVNINDFIAMTEAINHRGPDDTGLIIYSNQDKTIKEITQNYPDVYCKGFNCAIGFKRLSILDLSESGHQPMLDYENGLIIAFNGEIYNAFSFKPLLESKGFVFKSRTDTEVIMYLYQLLGFEKMLEKLNGMFSICIVDLKKEVTYIARDRMGIKPLYYYNQNNTLLFGSEIKSFLFHSNFNAKLNFNNIDEYTRFGFIVGEETLIKDVYSLLPGHFIEITPNNFKIKKYWEIYNGTEVLPISYNKAKELLEEKITESLKLQLLSDVKIGCQLSGGIDSSIITKLTSDNLKDYDINAISVILENQLYSEEKWIDLVAKKTGVNSHKFNLTDNYFADNLKKSIWHFDFPLLVPNSIGIFLLSEKAKEYFTVFLSGEGADELFAGYTRFYFGNIINKFWTLLSNTPVINKRIYNWSDGNRRNFTAADWYIAVTTQISPLYLKQMKSNIDFRLSIEKRKEIFNSGQGNFVRKCQRYELMTWLVDLLMRQDKMTMAHSVENRVPFLDHNIVDFARKLPTEYLSKIGFCETHSTKRILKKISEKHYSKEFTYRKKMGFELPLIEFYKHKTFYSWVHDQIIPGIKKRGVFNAILIEKYFSDLSKISKQEAYVAWTLISFEAWAQLYLDKEFENIHL